MRRFRMLGGSIHPFYRLILTRGVGAGFELPTMDCQRLQNTLVRALVDSGVWAKLDYLYIHAVAGATEFTGINWIQPNKALSTFHINAATVWVHKKGVHNTVNGGALNYGHNCSVDAINVSNDPFTGSSCFCMLGVAGSTIVTLESLYSCTSTVSQGGNIHNNTMRLRTTPQVDYLQGSTTASPGLIQTGLPVAQRLYTLSRATFSSAFRTVITFNGVFQTESLPVNMGSQPLNAVYVTANITSGRALALIGGGASLYYYNNALPSPTPNSLLNTAIQNYFNALQTLP